MPRNQTPDPQQIQIPSDVPGTSINPYRAAMAIATATATAATRGFTPINRWNGGALRAKSLIPERPADRTGSSLPQWETEALKARATNRRRSRNPRTKPMLRAGTPETRNTDSLHEHTVAAKPPLSSNSFNEAAFVPGKSKRANSSGTRGGSFDIRNPATKAIERRTFRSGTRVPPLTDSQAPMPLNSLEMLDKRNLSGKVLRRAVQGNCSGRFPVANSDTKFLGTFKLTTPSALDQPPAARFWNLVQDDHIDIEPHASTAETLPEYWHYDTQGRTDVSTAKDTPEEGFDWDQSMDDALLDHLEHIEANSNYDLQVIDHVMGGESTGIGLGLEHHCKRSSQVVENRGSTGTGMDGDVDDEDFIALLSSHQGPGHSHTKPESTKLLGGCLSTCHAEAPSGAFPDAESLEPVNLSIGGISDDEEDFPFGTGWINGITQPSGVTERFSPPSSLQYPFDDSSQTLEVYDSNLRCSTPPTEEKPGSDNVVFTDEVQYGASASVADMPFGGDSDEIMDQTADVPDQILAVTDDELDALDEDCIDDRDSGLADLNPLSLLRDPADDPTTKRKIRIRIPQPPEAICPSTPPKSKLPPHLLEYDASGQPKPFVRPAFPERVQDRSPVVGLSSKTFLRTCFRVGEALRAGSHASRWGQDAVIELYARVVFSSRDGWRQHFQFADLFHDRPPFLNGTYEVFHGVDLWEGDSSRFLTEEGKGKMCRCIGRMKRVGTDWRLVVLNVWEAAWDDVAWVKGIVCA